MKYKLRIIVLAGGKGTRIKAILGETPKIMGKIAGTPFISYLIQWLNDKLAITQKEIIFATRVGHNFISNYVQAEGLKCKLVREKKALGTLGAAANCAKQLSAENEPFLILNGDTLFEVDLYKAYQRYLERPESPLVILKKAISNGRYGGYNLQDEKLVSASIDAKYISMGAVFTRGKDLIKLDNEASEYKEIRMMDDDFIKRIVCRAYVLDNMTEFIDIGVPESYEQAQTYIPKYFQ